MPDALAIFAARSRRRASGARSAACLAATVWSLLPLATTAAVAGAQMPGVPVLQNGFVRPGAAVAANYASTDGGDVYGAAGAWTPGSGRFQVSAGVGSYGLDASDGRQTTGGLRVALPIRTPWSRDAQSAIGLAAFLGVGGASLSEGTLVQVPLGVGAGYRRTLGDDRAVAVFATPFFQFTRLTGVESPAGTASSVESSLFRVALGAETLLTRRVGLTLGYELGATAEAGNPGPTGGIFGAGVAFVF